MTLQEAYNLNVGQSVPSPDGDPEDAGQCVSWASYVLKNVYNHPYIYANAIDWWLHPDLSDMFNFIPFGMDLPKTGDFVVWGDKVGSQFGHIDVCSKDGTSEAFTGYDSNWGDKPILTTINHDYRFGILGYIREKEANMSTVGSVEIDQMSWTYFGYGAGKDFVDLHAGEETNTFERWMFAHPQTQAYKAQVATWRTQAESNSTPGTGFKPLGQTVYVKE